MGTKNLGGASTVFLCAVVRGVFLRGFLMDSEANRFARFRGSVTMSAIRRLHALGLLCLLAWGFLLGSAAPAQTFRGTILGTVTDSSGGAVVGATVVVKNVDT